MIKVYRDRDEKNETMDCSENPDGLAILAVYGWSTESHKEKADRLAVEAKAEADRISTEEKVAKEAEAKKEAK